MNSFIPAFTKLANYLEQLIEISEDQVGLYHFANGRGLLWIFNQSLYWLTING